MNEYEKEEDRRYLVEFNRLKRLDSIIKESRESKEAIRELVDVMKEYLETMQQIVKEMK